MPLDLVFEELWEDDMKERVEGFKEKSPDYENELMELSHQVMYVLRGDEGSRVSRISTLQNYVQENREALKEKVPRRHVNGLLMSAMTFANFNVMGCLIKEMGATLPTKEHHADEYQRISLTVDWSSEKSADEYGFRKAWVVEAQRVELMGDRFKGRDQNSAAKKSAL
jgi:hypothetical protein